MTSKSELKVGDLVRRVNPYGGGNDGAGIVIAIDRRHRLDDTEVCVKWIDTTRGQGHWYPHQLKIVSKE
tara:strand:+ start:1038 stop:1244 length:207 start_codon:yes stop_codon:yes gene_type:complete